MSIWDSPMSEGDNNQWRVLSVYIADLSQVTLNKKLVDALPLDFAGRFIGLRFVTGTTPASTAGKDIDLAAKINTTQTTGGLLTLITAGCDATGEVTSSTAVTANDEFTAGDTLTIQCVEATAAFAQGSGTLLVYLGET